MVGIRAEAWLRAVRDGRMNEGSRVAESVFGREDRRAEAPGVFAADEVVGRDLAAVDWAATPLGPPAGWPQSLQTTIGILLSSRFAMWMAWGPQLTFFCNAAYRRDTLGRKYPWALGRPAHEVWAEIWDDIGPRIKTVLSTGRATWDEALQLFLERSGFPEETYHTFSYSPLRDESGAAAGMLCVVREDTDRVIGERRMATLRDLGSDPSVVRTEREVLAFSGRILQRNTQDLPFTLTYLYERDLGSARLAYATGITAGHPAAAEAVDLDDERAPWPAAALARGASVVVALDGARFANLPTGGWPLAPTQALVVPLPQQGSAPYGFVVAALNRYRPLDEGYRGFVELVAGQLAAGVGSARSFQAQQRRAEDLAELDRAKTVFFSNVSHELRTPLTLIAGPAEELGRLLGDRADPRAREELDVIRRNALRLGKLVNTLLDFSRIEAGRMQARFELTDLAAATLELASVFRSAMERAGLEFTVDCPALPEQVYVDRGMWEKVVLNLLSNALKYTFHGAVSVQVRAEGAWAVFVVTDTGVGVAEADVPRLFERFHRIENARSRSNEGSGIGLALVRELLALHGGTIEAASVEHQGTAFTVRLPFGRDHLPAEAVVDDEAGATVSPTAEPFLQEALRWLPSDAASNPDHSEAARRTASGVPAGMAGRGAPARIVIADDNADMRDYLSRLLRTAGHTVIAVVDGLAALEACRTQAPDLLMADVMMPRLDGLRLVGELRADPATAGIPIVLLSARAGEEASIEGLEAGADDYLVKPFSAPDLLARVRTTVELARLRAHHARWRSALVDSLQEAFFVCDEHGTVREVNAGFANVLGYGAEGLPYAESKPWWPDPEGDPEAYGQAAEAFGALIKLEKGSHTAPAVHRDGHRIWINVTHNHVRDPDTGRRVIVGTLRDVSAERHAIQRETAVAALSVALSRAASLDAALTRSLDELKSLWGARRVLAAVFSADQPPAVTSTDPDSAWDRLSSEDRAVLTALRAAAPLSAAPVGPEGDARGFGVGMEHPRGPMALWLDLGGHRPAGEEDRTLLSLLAGHLAQGLARAHQIDEQRRTALALQRSILGPCDLPAGFAVRYEPAARPLEVGGDWYDIIALPDGRIGVVVGDCVGRGLQAATVMGQLRSACRALLINDPRPDRVLTTLDHYAAGIAGAKCTTVVCGVLDPATGELTYASAGHPPGVLVHPDGTVHLLDEGRSVPLAARFATARPSARHTIPPRATLIFYTDGLVERRRRRLTDGIDEAARAVRDGAALAVEGLATRVMERMAVGGGYEDDVALLLYRHPAPLDLVFPAEADRLATVRQALREWLAACGLKPLTVQNILVAAGEACANAVEHGYRDDPGGPVRLQAEATAENIRLTVTDSGVWKQPDSEAGSLRGRGLVLMRAMMSRVAITPGTDGGTTVTLETGVAV